MYPRFLTSLFLTAVSSSALLYLFGHQSIITPTIATLNWLAPLSLATAVAVSALFGHGKLVSIGMLLLIPALLPLVGFESALAFNYINQALLAVTALLWWKARGVNLLSMLTYGGVILVTFIAYSMLHPLWMQTIEPVVTPYWLKLYQLSPVVTETFSLLEFCVIALCLILLMLRIALRPGATTVVAGFTLATIVGLLVNEQHSSLLLVQTGLSIAIILAVIADTFHMAFRDDLTQLPSRRALNQTVLSLGRKYTVVMSDIDHFKKFNDTYGHDVGDQVLKLVASKLNRVQGGGKVFRYGGEEFTMLFAGKQAEQVEPFVESVRKTIEQYPIVLRGLDRPSKPPKKKTKPSKAKTVKITCSFGVAQRSSDEDFVSVMKRADEALYDAKKAGRNCVKCKPCKT
ncbi:GGDEF domain-containing protein [Aestuariibacter salexigens]|uniref:GGDEF domain-containing protein n=1 Tax=Aestuariibacter salexigens TaxID=226010 RepID=UPI000684FBFB|nr:GGDEF domain-containing protein [Aestuariibacter salexigens]